ncbi:hypothetical protein A2V71_04200 [Candidatus Berkelbacteria bacterium RBG_13_40_8]|uniref:Uncharacterized protein n=1 Tax=Candidatus Berkelbacteria bacterium RBG_13_40_8 TaxID=1797467 RepID=A0A1F5DNI5_9BACT|nr:MAG: hypothetical protein A2V71_04200 [Candidatus Berkelbacteria bacterium RBG_13_40_8]
MLAKVRFLIIHDPHTFMSIPAHVVAARKSSRVPIGYSTDVVVPELQDVVEQTLQVPMEASELPKEPQTPSSGGRIVTSEYSAIASEQIRPQKPEGKSKPPEKPEAYKFKGEVIPGEWLADALEKINFSVSLEENEGDGGPLFQLRIKQESLGTKRVGEKFLGEKEVYEMMGKIAIRDLMIKAHHLDKELDSHGWHQLCTLILRPVYGKEAVGEYLDLKFPRYGPMYREKLFVEFPELSVVTMP